MVVVSYEVTGVVTLCGGGGGGGGLPPPLYYSLMELNKTESLHMSSPQSEFKLLPNKSSHMMNSYLCFGSKSRFIESEGVDPILDE